MGGNGKINYVNAFCPQIIECLGEERKKHKGASFELQKELLCTVLDPLHFQIKYDFNKDIWALSYTHTMRVFRNIHIYQTILKTQETAATEL